MAKSARNRALPSTPQASPGSYPQPVPPAPGEPVEQEPSTSQEPEVRTDREYLITGTGCVAGHVRGQELDAGRIGQVPTRKQSRTGFALLCWCLGGALFLFAGKWSQLALMAAALWLAFAAVIVRSAGHRGRCWRTRSWRHAWGGLAPTSGADPTRPAGT